jgi:TRAP-type C4-dicarboxylate transport system substrate-binding protein
VKAAFERWLSVCASSDVFEKLHERLRGVVDDAVRELVFYALKQYVDLKRESLTLLVDAKLVLVEGDTEVAPKKLTKAIALLD